MEEYTGVESSAVAGQTTESQTTAEPTTETQTTQTETGVDTSAAAGQTETASETGVEGAQDAPGAAAGQDVEKAFAARLASAQEKFRQEESAKLKQQARDEFYAEQRIEWPPGSGKVIKTEAEYKQAQQENDAIQRYKAMGYSDDVVQQLTEVERLKQWRKDTETQAEQQKAEQAAAARANDMYGQFLKDFPEYKDTETAKTIPKEVFAQGLEWLESGGAKGLPLSAAMANHLFRQSRQKDQTGQLNAQNAQSSTGSAKGGTPKADYISPETFEANRHDQDWINTNYTKIMESRRKW